MDRLISVLLVDDNDEQSIILSRLLQEKGYSVAVALNGKRALQMLALQHRFDLIFLSVRLPDMPGQDVLDQMRNAGYLEGVPLIVTASVSQITQAVRCLERGAEDFLLKPYNTRMVDIRIRSTLERHILEKQVSDLLNVVIPIGVQLSAEKDFDRLLENILLEAKALSYADGGTLYLLTPDDNLQFVIVRNDTLSIALGGTTGKPVDGFPLIPLYDADRQPNYHNVATYTALSGETINVADAYSAKGFDFSGTQAFDQRTGYRSVSFLNIPLKEANNKIIGVLQLINAKDPDSGEIVPFDTSLHQVVESLASLATVALKAYLREEELRRQIEDLQIEIDETRREREVAQITDSEYFKDLQQRAKNLRGRSQTGIPPLSGALNAEEQDSGTDG